MPDFPTDMVLDALIAVLLAATIFYCAMLDRRLKALRSGQDGLRGTIDQLNTATARAEVSIAQLKQTSGEMDSGLSEQVRRATEMADELSVMVASGNKLADRLSGETPSRSRRVQPAERSRSEKVVPLPSGEAERRPAAAPGDKLENGINRTLLEALKRAR